MSTVDSATALVDSLLNAGNTNRPSQSNRSSSEAAAGTALSLKRPASPDPDEQNSSRKRMREDSDDARAEQARGDASHAIDGHALAEDLAQELQCGCCSELVYRPVVVAPCDHFFCGSCCTLWVKNGGANCPACRGVSTSVTPSRALQSMVDVLLRAAPYRQRTERERMQADEIYPTLRAFRIPVPREPSPEPSIPTSSDYVQPCPHCSPNNTFNWTCPQPIPDPTTDAENAWHVNDGTPPGHGFCGNCEVLLALQAPSTTRCDFCQVSFCGINVQGRCVALGLTTQSPHGMADVADLIQSPEVYECFENNTVEVEFMIDYMTAHRLSPKHIYRQIAAHIQSQPNGFRSLIEQDLFMDMHAIAGGTDPDPSAPRRSICRLCATEVFLYGLRDWWVRERRKAVRDGTLAERKDCPDGRTCRNVNDLSHAKEFNHITTSQEFEPSSEAAVPQPEASTSTISGSNLAPSSSSSTVSSALRPAEPTNTDLSSISDFGIPHPPFAALRLPTSPPRHAISLFTRADTGDGGMQVVVEAAPSVQPLSEPATDNHGHGQIADDYVDIEVDVDEDEHAEPSSSQSQRAVEAHLAPAMLTEYDSDPESESECVQEDKDKDSADADEAADAQLEACYAAAVAQAEAGLPSVRRAQSQPKMSVDVELSEHMPMEDVLPTVSISDTLSAFNLLPSMPSLASGSGGSAPRSTRVHPVQVE